MTVGEMSKEYEKVNIQLIDNFFLKLKVGDGKTKKNTNKIIRIVFWKKSYFLNEI